MDKRATAIREVLSELEGAPPIEIAPGMSMLWEEYQGAERQNKRSGESNVVYFRRHNDVVEYAERWARLMQLEIKNYGYGLSDGEAVVQCANFAALRAAPSSRETVNYIKTAALILIQCWVHGDALRVWLADSRYVH